MRASKIVTTVTVIAMVASTNASTATGQTAAISPAEGRGNCQYFSPPIGRLEGGVVTSPRIESCANGIADVTPPPYNKLPGEITVMSLGRYQNKQLPYILRGRPNVAYAFQPVYLAQLAGRYLYDPTWYPLSRVPHALPFQPSTIVDLGDLGNGQKGYGYTDLVIMASHARDALPLNRRSVVIAIDGFNFVTPAALTAYLEQTAPTETAVRYVEIAYFQSDEKLPVIRRALIPLHPRSAMEPAWSATAASNAAFSNNGSWVERNRGAIAIVLFAGLAGLIAKYNASEAGQRAKQNYDSCMREYSSSLRAMSC